MARRRNRIIYASQSVQCEGRILYRVQTFGSTTTFNTTDIFELGQLNLTDVVDDSPEVAVTLDTMDYGSIYTMATLAKVPTHNLNHNIRQSDGVTFFGTVGAFGDTSEGDLDATEFSGLPAASGSGKANIVIKDAPGGSALAYLHGVQLVDFGRECGVSKGLDIYSPIQSECALGTANDDVEFTKLLRDVFINRIDLNYQSGDMSSENYGGVTEKKQWLLNSARFLSWEEWRVGGLSNEILAATLGAKTKLVLSLPASAAVATLEDRSIAFLKKDLAGRPAILFQFTNAGGLAASESKSVPVFDKSQCTPASVTEFFLYDSSTNEIEYFQSGASATLLEALPAGRSAYQNGDKIFVFYAASEFAKEVGESGRPVSADSSYVLAKYFAPINSEDVEDVGAVRQGQVEAYLVDPDLVINAALTGATISGASITFSNTVDSSVDLSSLVGLKLRVTSGPGKDGPAREITAAVNNIVGSYNNGTVSLAGSDWSQLRLVESSSEVSTDQEVYVSNLCNIDENYIGADITVVASGVDHSTTISGIDTSTGMITLAAAASDPVDNASVVLVSVEPSTSSEITIGDYELALRLQNVRISADLAREMQQELGHLAPYARTLTVPIKFTANIDTTASDLETFAKLCGKLSEFNAGTLTDLDIIDLLSKDNLSIVVMVYQQTDEEAGGTGADRKVLSADMFNDEYFVDGIRRSYSLTDGSLREYPLKTVVVQNLRITEEAANTPITGNGTQTFAFRGTNDISALRGFVSIELATKTIESQGE